jgi:aspartate/methionine/tyrosine aminotransferase
MLHLLGRDYRVIPSNEANRFRPKERDYDVAPRNDDSRVLLVKSNPCNPTGVATSGEELRRLVELYSGDGRAALFDEAYELYNDPEPDSALRYIDDIDETDIFVIGAATKGLQVPGMRVGWAVASKKHVEIFRNYSSIGMGGVSRPSQIYVTGLLELDRARQAREAVARFYNEQRARYARGLESLGFELFTGNGGFYHWARLPGELTADAFNERLFEHDAAILPGRLCDLTRREGEPSPLDRFVRFSFGPLPADSFAGDMEILARCV